MSRKKILEQNNLAIKTAGYESISIRQLAQYWDGKGALPDKPIIVTFDDARRRVYQRRPGASGKRSKGHDVRPSRGRI